MDQLWAPWRIQYVQQSQPEPGCLFCNVLADDDDERHFIVHRGAASFVMLNLYPYNSGHLMVVPFQHTGRFDEVRGEVGADLFHTSQLAVRALEDVMRPDAFNLGINQGKTAGAGVVDHIHVHVVPRWEGDTNFMPVLADTKVMPELLSETAAKLRPAFQKLASGP